MLSLKLIRANPQLLYDALKKRNHSTELADQLLELDKQWRAMKAQADALKAERNSISIKISELKKQNQPIEHLLSESRKLAQKIEDVEKQTKLLEDRMDSILLLLPNIPHDSVPVGNDETANKVVRTWGKIKKTGADVKPHYEVAASHLIDFQRGAKIAGHRFVVLRGLAARLERALINFMLDLHIMNGYLELLPPFLVNSKTMTGTGQLPKFSHELYKCKDDDLYLIPTAEVPLTNYFADEILEETQLPVKFCAYTPCFRREAGAYQKDIKGIIRQHQFDKVELVRFSLPERSYEELEIMVADAESVLKRLELPYRVVELCSGDLGFASAKTYDLEVWLPSQDCYREISSCSNCADFQARRANIRFRRENKLEFVHTLNGSGVAVGRCMVAIMENFQDENGFSVPKVLQDYMKVDRIDF
ncbi:MAG: serine--tRNA ligase [Candidatus Micrarchaeota archaeon]|nr:serine--tRNA ligase [Candidatus Micrarchaeota archaeon]